VELESDEMDASAVLRRILKSAAYNGCHVVSSFLYPFVRLRNKFWPDGRVRMLVYHRICEMPPKRRFEYYNIQPVSFAAQMECLAMGKYAVLTVGEVIEYLSRGKAMPRKAVCITFDDGYRNNYTEAFPVLQRYGLRATFYVVTEYMDSNRRFAWLKRDATTDLAEAQDAQVWQPLQWVEIQKMSRNGMEIASHSCTHPDFSGLDPAAMDYELEGSRRHLIERVGNAANSFVCPFSIKGVAAKRLKDELKKRDYKAAFLGRIGAAGAKSDLFDLPRMSVYSSDSLAVFRRKIDGAYDWLEWLQPVWTRLVRE
jgi:peptidoglycan/xylan/chitin deacetylase (PgdA/CDA1 family)